MEQKAEVIYLDDVGNVVAQAQARRVRITLVDAAGHPIREIWGDVYHPDDANRWPNRESEYDLLG